MAQKSLFKTEFEESGCPPDPESLFHDLKGRAEEIRHLWSHQADLLRAYTKDHLTTPDIALELPTGAGKTLVALLIAEFRRRKLDERVAYLCPTRQLANQVGGQAKRYGITAHVLVGRQKDYDAAGFDAYQRGRAIAVTTYSGLFNTNPRIKDPTTIVLDDAHSSENYISSMWSLELNRKDHTTLIEAIFDLFAPELPVAFAERLRSESAPKLWARDIDMVPGKHLRDRLPALRDLITASLPEGDEAAYSWQMIRDHLADCNLFLNWGGILLRPLIPPAQTHAPFAGAKQRVYMSATLGAGGELERITGVRQIQRLPIPAGWDQRGSGRRLFLMPELSCEREEAVLTAVDVVRSVKRALALVPNEGVRRETSATFEAGGLRVLGREHIEDSLDPFTKSENTVLVLANRYDGIDLPDDSCRLLIVMGLPVGTNLQESFLLTRLAASSLLRDRMLTRLTQGVGRCTRSDRDYSAVLLLDRNLIEFVLRSENRRVLHPELQAELQFGMENSDGKSRSDFVVLVQALIAQKEEWAQAERAILSLRSKKKKEEDQVAKRLKNVAADEVDFVYALWTGNLERALEKARAVSDNLGGNETKGYRGWWYYLVADTAARIYDTNSAPAALQIAKEYYGKAATCSLSISWFAELALLTIEGAPVASVDELTPVAVEKTRTALIELGLTGQRFEQQMGRLLTELDSRDHDTFERGVETLGSLLGFDSTSPDATADPDCVWSIGDKLHIVHEVKVEHSPGDEIGANDVRQAASHANWVKAHRSCSANSQIVCVIETPRERVEAGGIPHAENLFYVSPAKIKELAEETVSVLRSVRAGSPTMPDESLLETLLQEMGKHRLLPHDVQARMTQQLVSKMPTGKKLPQ
jgi:Rad3-related DNA helicase